MLQEASGAEQGERQGSLLEQTTLTPAWGTGELRVRRPPLGPCPSCPGLGESELPQKEAALLQLSHSRHPEWKGCRICRIQNDFSQGL